ncbi:MAG: hypothetical protein ABDH49_08265 [Candidatus Hydrothermales bacterium]
MSIPDRLLNIPRPVIFILIGLAVFVPLLFKFLLPLKVLKPVKDVYDFIESLPEGTPVILSFDYSPDVLPECYPMSLALAKHLARKKLRIYIMTLYPAGAGFALDVYNKILKEFNLVERKDIVFVGYFPSIAATILGIGEDIRNVFKTDYFGVPFDEIEAFRDVKNYEDIKLVITISGAAIPESWMVYANGRYGANVAAGVTAVMAAQLYPYYRSKQFIGLIGGMRGAAEYEKLLNAHNLATKGMNSISLANFVMVLLVILGNISFFIKRRRKR